MLFLIKITVILVFTKLQQKSSFSLSLQLDSSDIYAIKGNISENYVRIFVPIDQVIYDCPQICYIQNSLLSLLKYLMILSTIVTDKYFQHLC